MYITVLLDERGILTSQDTATLDRALLALSAHNALKEGKSMTCLRACICFCLSLRPQRKDARGDHTLHSVRRHQFRVHLLASIMRDRDVDSFPSVLRNSSRRDKERGRVIAMQRVVLRLKMHCCAPWRRRCTFLFLELLCMQKIRTHLKNGDSACGESTCCSEALVPFFRPHMAA